jgi:hypothetical protein
MENSTVKIRIDKEGYLSVLRGSKFRDQSCPYHGGACGDWCPLFHEPRFTGNKSGGGVALEMCSDPIWYCKVEEFVDERE